MSVAGHAENLEAGAGSLTGASEADAMFDLEALPDAVVKEDPYRYPGVPNFARPDALAASYEGERRMIQMNDVDPAKPEKSEAGNGKRATKLVRSVCKTNGQV